MCCLISMFDFPVVILLISSLIPLLSENKFTIVSIILTFPGLLLWSRIWSTLIYALWRLEKNVCTTIAGLGVL